MTQLRITCFHVFHATIDEQPVAFRSNKGRALLLYLAVEQRAHNRSALAGLLWPDLPENHARRNLSQTLLEVHKAIGDQTLQSPFLQTTDQQLSIATGDLWVDATIFEQTIIGNDYAQETVLYTGPFLANFTLPDSDLWEEWAERKREHYRHIERGVPG